MVGIDRESAEVQTRVDEPAFRTRMRGRLVHDGQDLAVGDWVALVDGQIDSVLPRRTLFQRKRSGTSSASQVIASNVELCLIAMSLNEDFSPQRAERYLIAAWDAGTTPILLLTKADLVEEAGHFVDELSAVAAGCEIVVVSALEGVGLDQVRSHIGAGRAAVLVGSSGVGKSTLVNALVGSERQQTAAIREDDAKGRHTTTRRELLRLPGGGLLIDTPGMREFGIAFDEDGEGVHQGFSDIEELAELCAFRDCQHEGEPDCAVEEAIASGQLPMKRLKSYRKLLREIAFNERRGDAAKEREERLRWKKIHKSYRERTRHSPKR